MCILFFFLLSLLKKICHSSYSFPYKIVKTKSNLTNGSVTLAIRVHSRIITTRVFCGGTFSGKYCAWIYTSHCMYVIFFFLSLENIISLWFFFLYIIFHVFFIFIIYSKKIKRNLKVLILFMKILFKKG